MNLTEKQIAVHITTRCTLNCKLCATMMPAFREHNYDEHVPLETIEACNWCNGFDTENSPRFPAGEQA